MHGSNNVNIRSIVAIDARVQVYSHIQVWRGGGGGGGGISVNKSSRARRAHRI